MTARATLTARALFEWPVRVYREDTDACSAGVVFSVVNLEVACHHPARPDDALRVRVACLDATTLGPRRLPPPGPEPDPFDGSKES